MGARGSAGDDDEARIDAVFLGVLADPRDRSLHVDEVSRKRGARAEPVVDVEADPSARGEVTEQRDALQPLQAADPRATMDLHDRRAQLAGLARTEHVELQAGAVDGAELDMALHHDVAPHERERGHEQVQIGVARQGFAVLDHAAAPQRRSVPLRANEEDDEPDPGGERERDPDDAGPSRQRAEPHERDHDRHLPRDPVAGRLAHCETGDEALEDEPRMAKRSQGVDGQRDEAEPGGEQQPWGPGREALEHQGQALRSATSS